MKKFRKICKTKMAIIHTKFIVLFVLLFTIEYATANDGRFYIEAGAGYSKGDYASENSLGMFYLSPKIGYSSTRYYVNLVLPYLFISDDSDQQNGMMMDMNVDMGLGDIVLSGGRLLYKGDNLMSLYGSLLIKFPTADETKNLGSGETDYGGYLNFELPVNSVNLSLRGGYLIIGDSDSQDNNDIYLYGIGASKWIGQSKFIISVKKRRSLITGYGNPLELFLGYFHKLNNDYSFNGNVTFGLNDNNNDLGVSASITRWF